MNPMERIAEQMSRFGRNTAYNLGFIAEDKLNWKPAPTASSALEIASHAVGTIKAIAPILAGGEFTRPQPTPLTTLKEAQEQLRSTAEEYAGALRRLSPAELERTVQLPFGPLPLAQAAAIPVIDLIHHHGQIAYIQTMLGDTETHFERV
jgi:DinB family protein